MRVSPIILPTVSSFSSSARPGLKSTFASEAPLSAPLFGASVSGRAKFVKPTAAVLAGLALLGGGRLGYQQYGAHQVAVSRQNLKIDEANKAARLSKSQQVAYLQGYLKNPDAEIRRAGVNAIGSLENPSGKFELLKPLCQKKDSDTEVNDAVRRVVQSLKDGTIKSRLEEFLLRQQDQ